MNSADLTKEAERYRWATHLMRMRLTCGNNRGAGLEGISCKAAVACARYCDLLPADRVFMEAGTQVMHNLPQSVNMPCAYADFQARSNKNEALAFRLLNRFLDISDSMGDPDASLQMDNADFEGAGHFLDSQPATNWYLQARMCHSTLLCPV